MVETEVQQPALVATSLAMLAALRARGVKPDYVIGHSVGEFAAIAAAKSVGVVETIALVRERGLAMAEAAKERPGSMAAILGLDDEVVERLCRKILGVWPANYNCPGQIVVSGENDAVDELCAKAAEEGARRTVKLKVSGAFHSPLVARAAERLRPAIESVKFGEPQAAFMSTVTARFEEAQRMGCAARRPADRAGAVHAGRVRTRPRRREDVRRGRPGQRALRADEADRPQREGDLGQRPRLAREDQGAPAHRVTVARLRLARAGETAGFPREPPSPTAFAPQQRFEAAPAMSVAAAETFWSRPDE